MKNLRLKKLNKVIICHININSLRNKFELVTEMVRNKVDLLIISEIKLDFSFPSAQFYMKTYSRPYRLDRNNKGGGVILYVREDISSKFNSEQAEEATKRFCQVYNFKNLLSHMLQKPYQSFVC